MEKGSTAEGCSRSKLQPWVVAEYAPNCHESGVLSCWIDFQAMNKSTIDAFIHGCFVYITYFERK